jgi:hypothetical protein
LKSPRNDTGIAMTNLHRSPPMNQSETDLGIVNESQLLRFGIRQKGTGCRRVLRPIIYQAVAPNRFTHLANSDNAAMSLARGDQIEARPLYASPVPGFGFVTARASIRIGLLNVGPQKDGGSRPSQRVFL